MPPEFNDQNQLEKPIPARRTKKQVSEKPIPKKRTIITKVNKGYTQSFEVELRDEKDPLAQLQISRRAIEHLFKNLLIQTKGFKFVETLQVKFVKYANDKKFSKLVISIPQ